MKAKYLLSIFILFSLLFATGGASASPLYAPLGTGFTYQGKLTDGGVPANGHYEFEFKLFDALSGGNQVGSTLTIAPGGLIVTNGLFTAQLDFGNVFDGTALYLEVGVRPSFSVNGYPFTALVPRTPLTATPYAVYASKVPWTGLTGVPAGFADGVDNSGAAYQNIKVVAKSGGDYTTITAALNSIVEANPNNPYLIYVAPGVYNEQVVMKPYVDIQGSGELTTKITFTGNAGEVGTVLGANNAELRFLTVENTGGDIYGLAIFNDGTSPRLSHVTANASGGITYNLAVYNKNSASPTMKDVTASASGGENSYGVYNYNTSSPIMTEVTASASEGTSSNFGINNNQNSSPKMTNTNVSSSGGTNNYGLYNNNFSSPEIMNITINVSGGTNNYGVYNRKFSGTMTNVTANALEGIGDGRGVYNENSSGRMTNVIAISSGSWQNNYGVYNNFSSTPIMTNVTASASGGVFSYGVYNDNSTPIINNSTLNASGGISGGIGLLNTSCAGSCTVLVNNSQISGSTITIANSANFITRVGASQISGGAVNNAGTLICAGVYDENYTFYSSTCP